MRHCECFVKLQNERMVQRQIWIVESEDWGIMELKLDGVGPIDNRPSTDKPHQIIRIF